MISPSLFRSKYMTSTDDKPGFLAGGGAMGERIRAFPWEQTPLGNPHSWPQGLRTAVRVLLTTQHPVFIFWGAEHTCLYNDAYSRSIGTEKHPSILGAPGKPSWLRNLAHHRSADRTGNARRRGDLAREPARAHHPSRRIAGCVLDLQLQPHRPAGLPSWRWWCTGAVQRDHRAGACAAAADGRTRALRAAVRSGSRLSCSARRAGSCVHLCQPRLPEGRRRSPGDRT